MILTLDKVSRRRGQVRSIDRNKIRRGPFETSLTRQPLLGAHLSLRNTRIERYDDASSAPVIAGAQQYYR
ncbi:hypothetical protein A0H81_07806 [Grifola frondosa]|uniref:Uncharacterized protein n=1 Tax=Grifola frondosa TaxID=5627 RepID=A0A1C7M5S7_GRIFR|nr:hypothetical protein A0H81_07806 [Grifola frondosa]